MPRDSNCWHCGEPLAGGRRHSRDGRGPGARRCAARVAAPRPNGSSSWALRDYYELRTAPAPKPDAGACHARFLAGRRQRAARDPRSGRGPARNPAADRRRALHRLRLADRALARRDAGSGERAGQCGGATRAGDLAGIEDHAAATAAGAVAHRIPRAAARRAAASTICGAASHATRSSGCWSPASARCRP